MYGTARGTVRGAYGRSRHFPVNAIANRYGFDFAFVRPELIDDPRYDTAEARSRNSEEVVALISVGCGGYSFMGKTALSLSH